MKKRLSNMRWKLVAYDAVILLFVELLLLVICAGDEDLSLFGVAEQVVVAFVCVFAARFIGNIYGQIWRYGGIQCYIRLLLSDAGAFIAALVLEWILPIENIMFERLLAISSINLLGALAIRMIYRYAYKCGNNRRKLSGLFNAMLHIFAGPSISSMIHDDSNKIKIAIIGAGQVGVLLADELVNNPSAAYTPCCFVDSDNAKVGREIRRIPVIPENETTLSHLKEFGVQEIVFAIPNLEDGAKKKLYSRYLKSGYKIKVYDYPVMETAGKKRYMREFDIEELLFRKPVVMKNKAAANYYRDRVVLITGGGGSIGSELCRQLAKMKPRQIIILDIYENGAYDVQQELKIAYGCKLDIRIEIVSITNKRGMMRVFETYHPNIVINAAAHKHVPLMENNCIEAVENNVFGTKNLIELCEEYEADRFMMVSTDKAVNPTNVMGATKRMCEMMVQSASTYGNVKYSATRFGNVLGSAGSVIPLFKKQIASGGPITLTDKRIIRYFMTIPEASQLVLQSGAMAHNGELFVLDMGQPVKIYDLAKSMIRLSGVSDISIIETGLRPGEKLYEELLVKTEELTKTENKMIFIERDTPLDKAVVDEKLEILRKACDTNDDEEVRKALKTVVPTYKEPEVFNAEAEAAPEMKVEPEPLLA